VGWCVTAASYYSVHYGLCMLCSIAMVLPPHSIVSPTAVYQSGAVGLGAPSNYAHRGSVSDECADFDW
jgi:hypothetical protein